MDSLWILGNGATGGFACGASLEVMKNHPMDSVVEALFGNGLQFFFPKKTCLGNPQKKEIPDFIWKNR